MRAARDRYLNTIRNDEQEQNGGCTSFPCLEPPIDVSPLEGQALLFCNLDPADPYSADWRTIHEAKPIAPGQTKLGVNIWVRDESQQQYVL